MHRCGTCCCCDTSHLIFLSSPIRALGNAIQETACVGGPDPVAGAVVPYDQKLLPTSSPTQVSGSACGPFGPGMLGIRISEEEYAPEKQIPETLIAIAIVRTFIIIHSGNAGPCSFASLMAEARVSGPARPAGSSPNWYVNRPFNPFIVLSVRPLPRCWELAAHVGFTRRRRRRLRPLSRRRVP
jgi:hypothetical protein